MVAKDQGEQGSCPGLAWATAIRSTSVRERRPTAPSGQASPGQEQCGSVPPQGDPGDGQCATSEAQVRFECDPTAIDRVSWDSSPRRSRSPGHQSVPWAGLAELDLVAGRDRPKIRANREIPMARLPRANTISPPREGGLPAPRRAARMQGASRGSICRGIDRLAAVVDAESLAVPPHVVAPARNAGRPSGPPVRVVGGVLVAPALVQDAHQVVGLGRVAVRGRCACLRKTSASSNQRWFSARLAVRQVRGELRLDAVTGSGRGGRVVASRT